MYRVLIRETAYEGLQEIVDHCFCTLCVFAALDDVAKRGDGRLVLHSPAAGRRRKSALREIFYRFRTAAR
jgi:hypothetical protein